ncbi:MAG: IMPACT family protein [Candidatus Zhuqueibacterota bacterium]
MPVMNEDEYFTIGLQQRTAELKIKGSRFIGNAAPVATEELATEFIHSIARQFYSATHNCYAYSFGLSPSVTTRFNDDGEPSGTAGQPILSAILGRNLANVAVVVTRYFGGTKLGKGGLVHAYADCANLALDACPVIRNYIYSQAKVKFDYALTGAVMHLVDLFDATVEESFYGDRTELALAVRRSVFEDFKNQLIEKTAGNISITH